MIRGLTPPLNLHLQVGGLGRRFATSCSWLGRRAEAQPDGKANGRHCRAEFFQGVKLAKERVERDEEDLVRLYLTDIGQYPLLTKDDEVRLAQAIETGREAEASLELASRRI